MTRHAMKSERERREPKSNRGEPAASQVAYNDCYSCDAIHLAQQGCLVVAAEVMQHLRAHYYVDTRVRKGKGEATAADRIGDCLTRCRGEDGRGVESDGSESDARDTCGARGRQRNVAKACPDIKERRVPRKLRKVRRQFGHRALRAAKDEVGSPDVPHCPENESRVVVASIEQLCAVLARRCQEYSHAGV